MLTVPPELAAYEHNNRLVIDGGHISDIGAVINYLKQQKHLTTVAISDAVEMPEWDGKQAGHALALALANCQSPNLLEAGIAGGDYVNVLMAKCDANCRNAVRLLKPAKDTTHALSKDECTRIKECLPAMVAIASATGPHASEHAMSTPQLLEVLKRIGRHAEQYEINTGVDAVIERLQPKPVVDACSATRAENPLVQFCQQGAFPTLGS